MLQPKKQKYRKQFRGKRAGMAQVGNQLAFGDYGLKCLGRGWLTARQIEAGRKAITHHTKRGGKMWIRVFPDKPVTKKPAGARMGGGKADIDGYVAVVRPGTLIFEISGVSLTIAKEAMCLASHKLPFKTQFIIRD
ncbi:50S ribosomal protein L16 [Patescibacteria group bacterium]|nr:50S ribosomal protein L16 [Patescibacteria group bacterium]MBU1931285.1 50S ribosomal protein L16 [Patescibacteria group bacterium]